MTHLQINMLLWDLFPYLAVFALCAAIMLWRVWPGITALWHRRLRRIDLKMLWPICKREAGDLNTAKLAFAFHALNDTAWTCLGEDEVCRIIDELK